LGGYAAYWAGALFGVDPFIALPFIFVLFSLIGWALGPLIYRVRTSRYARPDLMALAFTFGIYIFMRGGALWLWSFDTRNVTSTIASGAVTLGPVTMPVLRLVAFGFALALSLALFVFLHRTRLGLAVRAVAQSRENAGLMGINVKRVSAAVYG